MPQTVLYFCTLVHYFTLGEVLIFLSVYNDMYVHIWFYWPQTEKNGLYSISIDIHIYMYSLFESAVTNLGHRPIIPRHKNNLV